MSTLLWQFLYKNYFLIITYMYLGSMVAMATFNVEVCVNINPLNCSIDVFSDQTNTEEIAHDLHDSQLLLSGRHKPLILFLNILVLLYMQQLFPFLPLY